MTTAGLTALLVKWRQTGAPEDAAVFMERARAAAASFSPPATGSEREFHRAWLRAADDPVGRGWALARLIEQLPGTDPIQQASSLAKRIEVLLRHGPDPRFAGAAATIRSLDVATGVRRLRAAVARLETAGLANTTGALPLVTVFPPPTPEIQALWRTAEAHPDDDGAVAVLADALQGIGDPRGELLALQLAAGSCDEPERSERQRRLVASCGAAWLGRLVEVTQGASFERGVLRRLQFSRKHRPTDPIWDRLVGDPALASIVDLVGGYVNGQVYARFVTSPAMRSLTRIEVFDQQSLAAVVRAVPSLAHVAYAIVGGRERNELIEALEHRPGVTSIAIAEPELEPFMAAPWFRRLSALTLAVGTHIRRGLAAWGALSPSMRLTLVPEVRLPMCTTSYPWDFGVTLERAGEGTIARVSGDWLLLPLDVLTALPPDVVRIDVDHPSPIMVDRIRSALARPAVDIVHRPVRRLIAVFNPEQREPRWET